MSWMVLNNPAPVKRSMGSRFADAFNKGAQMLHENMESKRLASEENAALKRMGIDIEGIQSPEMRKAALTEGLRSQGKQKILQQKQSLLQDIFGGGQGQRNMGQELMGDQGQEQGQDQIGQQQMGGFNPSNVSDADIAQLTAVDPQLGNAVRAMKDTQIKESRAQKEFGQRHELAERQFAQKERLAGNVAEDKRQAIRRAEETKISDPVMLELNEARKNIPLQEQAIEDIEKSIPETGARDYLAELTGFEPLRTAHGAKLKTAIKDFFLSDLSRAGARPNQWIEQQLADALPKIGRDPVANQVVAQGMKFKVDLAKKRIEILDELAEEDREKHGFVKADVDSRASKLMRPYIEQRKKDLTSNIKQIYSSKGIKSSQFVRMVSPSGELYEILPEDIEEAEQNGFTHG